MWALLPTTMPKYLHYSPMLLAQDTMKAPVNIRLHLSQPRQAKDQIHCQRDYSEVPTLYIPWVKSYTNFTGHPKTGPVFSICQVDI